MEKYNHKETEAKWQKRWEESGIYRAIDNDSKKKYYCLIEFPYPSGEGLHVGHPRPYIGMDVIARKRRAEGYNVLYPIGWDAFGLPTENYAIKTGIQPAIVTKQNTDTFRRQIQMLGISFDWSREINTTDQDYYKWTQWIFLQFYKKGLAYKQEMTINWCPKCLIGLANEEVVNGACERCGTTVEKRDKEQWMLAITKYADRLDKDLDLVDFQERIKIQQRNWIGRSEGAEIEFKIEGWGGVKVFTTRADTLFGVTYLVLAPEHSLVQELKPQIKNWPAVEKHLTEVKEKTEIERTTENKEKTGVQLEGVFAINPANQEKIPVWVADYVLGNYGTGAVMAVPAHDERDWEFAKKYNLPIKEVIIPSLIDASNPPREGKEGTFRNMVLAIIYNPKTDKYLTLKWKTQPWTTFITGGVEEGETRLDAVRREIAEETGYNNIKLIRSLGMTEAHFFAAHKNVNRRTHGEHFLFELIDEDQALVADEEKNQYDLQWLSAKELLATHMQHAEFDILWERIQAGKNVYVDEGVLLNSGEFNDLTSAEARGKITEKFGQKKVTYKLRDWVFSRQRYWGEPIPMVYCEKDGWVPVPEKDLPVVLPPVEHYQPTTTGESPLAAVSDWVNVACPKCGGAAKRETDTMPNWAGSSWYYLRYTDAKNTKAFASPENLKYWTPVDWYNGGMEHTTLHLLYSRFWHKFLFDLELVPTSEPYKKRTAHGLILAEDGEKMSKSRGNVVNPDKIVELYGADTLRVYEMFMGPFDQSIAWSTESMMGPRRFLERVWKLSDKLQNSQGRTLGNSKGSTFGSLTSGALLHQTIKKVSEDIEAMRFNTAISSLMILLNEFEKQTEISREDYETFLRLLAPFAPHLVEELWSNLGHRSSIHEATWPTFDAAKTVLEKIIIAIQINGIMRDNVEIEAGFPQEKVEDLAKRQPKIAKWLAGKSIKRVIYVDNKIINFVV